MNTSILSPADQKTLADARKINARPNPVSFDTIKFKDSEKEVPGLIRGNFYIESYNSEKKEKTFRDIGPEPEIVVIHRCYTYSWYKEGEGLMAWTSDIQQLNEFGTVTLYARKDGKVTTVFQGPYKPDFQAFKSANYTSVVDGNSVNLLTFQNLLYVLFEGTVYRMFVSNASAAGIAPGGKAPDFKKPQEGCLINYINSTRGEQMDGALCESVCKLGAVFRKEMERPFYIRTFTNVGQTPMETLSVALAELRKISAAWREEPKNERSYGDHLAEENPTAIEIPSPYASAIRPEDLPF